MPRSHRSHTKPLPVSSAMNRHIACLPRSLNMARPALLLRCAIGVDFRLPLGRELHRRARRHVAAVAPVHFPNAGPVGQLRERSPLLGRGVRDGRGCGLGRGCGRRLSGRPSRRRAGGGGDQDRHAERGREKGSAHCRAPRGKRVRATVSSCSVPARGAALKGSRPRAEHYYDAVWGLPADQGFRL